MARPSSELSKAAVAFWNGLPLELRLSAEMIFFVPVLAKGVAAGLSFPDIDLITPGVGIGGHRWAVTHSALGAYLAKKSLEVIDSYLSDATARTVLKKAVSAGATGFCVGLSLHLLQDALWDNPQSVRFRLPFVGGRNTIIKGDLLDDNLWLCAHGLHALKMTRDILLLGFGTEAHEARAAFRRFLDDRETARCIQRAVAERDAEIEPLRRSLEQRIPVDGSRARPPAWLDETKGEEASLPGWLLEVCPNKNDADGR